MKRNLMIVLMGICMLTFAACGGQKAEKENSSNIFGKGDASAGIENDTTDVEMSGEEMFDEFYKQFYGEMSGEEVEQLVIERNSYYRAYSNYNVVTDYWENDRGVTDISNKIEPLFYTDMKYYNQEDFQNVPAVIIHLAKNEIYAKHGYIFKDEDLNNYFIGCEWYQPQYTSEAFDESVFNEYEQANIKLLSELE